MVSTLITLTNGEAIESPQSLTTLMALKEAAYNSGAAGIEVERVDTEPTCILLSAFSAMEGSFD